MINGKQYLAAYPVEEMSPEMLHWAKDAVLVQDACNLSGVVFAYGRAMKVICDESNRLHKDTDWKNCHPVAVLFASKVASLTGCGGSLEFSYAYEVCKKVTGE